MRKRVSSESVHDRRPVWQRALKFAAAAGTVAAVAASIGSVSIGKSVSGASPVTPPPAASAGPCQARSETKSTVDTAPGIGQAHSRLAALDYMVSIYIYVNGIATYEPSYSFSAGNPGHVYDGDDSLIGTVPMGSTTIYDINDPERAIGYIVVIG